MRDEREISLIEKPADHAEPLDSPLTGTRNDLTSFQGEWTRLYPGTSLNAGAKISCNLAALLLEPSEPAELPLPDPPVRGRRIGILSTQFWCNVERILELMRQVNVHLRKIFGKARFLPRNAPQKMNVGREIWTQTSKSSICRFRF